jgi:hypothetical protein
MNLAIVALCVFLGSRAVALILMLISYKILL